MAKKDATKLCKHCKSEIPAGAKVCPHCRKKQGGKFKFIFIAFVLICIVAAVGSSDKPKKVEKSDAGTATTASTDKVESSVDSAEPAEEKTTFSVGETAEQKNIQVTLVGTTESSGSEYVKPDDGKVFLILEFDIANNSNSDITVSSIGNFEAYCDDYSLNQDILGLQAPEANGKNQLDGSVAAGKKMNGVIVYQVPSDYKTFEINVAPSFWSTKDIKFVIEK